MSSIIWSIVAGALAGAASCLALLRLKARTALSAETTSAVAPATPASPPAPTGSPATETIVTVVSALAQTLSPLAEEVSHPAVLPDMPEFQGVVAALRRPDATVTLLGQYALGDNWPLACAAFAVLADNPQRQSLREAVLRHLPRARPYVILYALRFLNSLQQRPAPGAAVLSAQQWWQNNAVIPSFFDEYFKRSAELGDQADFGTCLDKPPELDSLPVIGLLQKIQHPSATQLLAAFRTWLDSRIDRDFLGAVGRLWDSAEQDPLLVEPPAWRELLSTAEAAVQQARPRSLLVCGDPRTGKSAFIELLARRFQQEGWTVFAASGTELQADQSYIGELEGRIRKLVEALHPRRKLLWYVRDLGQLATSGTHQGQSATMLDQILPAIVAGNLVVIGESTQAAATRLFQTRPSLRSLLDVVPLQPLDEGQTSALARQVAARITEHSHLAIPEPTLAATMDLAQHYLGTGQLPGVVLELLKRAANRSIAAGETSLTAESVVTTLSQISGLPPIILDTNPRVDLANVQDFFTRRAMLKAGLTDPGRPIGVFLFAGPTGTGKTELAKTLAEFLFGSAERLVRLDMSEFQTIESTTKILGQRDDGATESLIDRIRRQPFSVVLLDEFEKAHVNCWDLFLQIFDDGRLSDARGKEADFRHCIIILTSNLGATAHQGTGLGFRPDASVFAPDQVLRTIGQTFRPEFVNRLDKVIVFRPLSRELMRGILHKELARVLERRGLRDRAWAVEWEASAIEFLLDRGFSPEMGARPLKRAIDQQLLAPLAATLVEHRFPQGDQFLFVRSNGQEIEVEFIDPNADSATDASPETVGEADLSLPAMALRPSGSATERTSLVACWRQISSELAADPWRTKVDQLRLALADPAIWSRDDRHRVFSGLEVADRIGEASRTAERLFQRYQSANEHNTRAPRELAGRLALQLYNVRQGMDDFIADVPVDALLRVDPALDMGGDGNQAAEWCARLIAMYRQWATRRRMQIRELSSADPMGMPILLITGFGAYRTLRSEAGLHVLEDDYRTDAARRVVARVTTTAGPDRAATAAERLAAVSPTASIVRRYREQPAPLVRDMVGGWRSGRLSAVLGGDFDLIGAIKGQPTAS
jgi:ATP-dependent Clp protease ATP-binding subunit ClpC